MKKAKFFEKRKAAQEAEEAKLNGIGPKVIAPTPIRPAQSASTSTSSTPSRINTPLYPAIPERTVESPSLPPPLHSTKGKSRHEHDGPVILTPELEWDDQSSAEGEEEWAGIERIKGFTEREEDEALENDSALSKSLPSLELELTSSGRLGGQCLRTHYSPRSAPILERMSTIRTRIKTYQASVSTQKRRRRTGG